MLVKLFYLLFRYFGNYKKTASTGICPTLAIPPALVSDATDGKVGLLCISQLHGCHPVSYRTTASLPLSATAFHTLVGKTEPFFGSAMLGGFFKKLRVKQLRFGQYGNPSAWLTHT
jgi:hypothetical protein